MAEPHYIAQVAPPADIDDEVALRDRPFPPSKPEPKRPPLRFLTYAEMQAMPQPEWLIEGLIQRRSSALMFGKSNSFKSFLGVDIGLSVATGLGWQGRPAVKGRVAFVATEGAIGVGKFRIPAWFDHHGISERERQGIYLHPEEIRLDVAEDVTALIAAIKAIGGFELVILDIFGGTMAGSEVEDKTARAWVNGAQRILRETGAAILTVAHTGWQDDTRARMHTHFWGSFDSRMRVEGDKDALTTTLKIERHKDADSSGSWGFNLVPAGHSLVPVLDDYVKAPEKKKSKGDGTLDIALAALADALEAKGEIKHPAKIWPNTKVVRIDDWKAECVNHGLSSSTVKDSQDKAFNRASDRLKKENRVRQSRGYVWLCFD